MEDQRKEQAPPCFRIWLCGAFRVERRVGTTYEAVRTSDWGGSSYPRLLLKVLLCSPGRQARREALIEMLWPDADPEQTAQYLNTATTKLRKVLQPIKGQESLLITEDDYKLYRLEGQSLLWVDVDAALHLLKQVEHLGRNSSEALPYLEQAVEHFDRGMLLEEEGSAWVTSRRATVERTRYRCRIWLAEVCIQHGKISQAETVLNTLLEEDPTDEDVLCRLISQLHQQGMTHQAFRLYEHTNKVFVKEGIELSETTKMLVAQLHEERHSTPRNIVSPVYHPMHAFVQETIDDIPHFLARPKLLTFPVNLLTAQSSQLELPDLTSTPLPLPSLFRTDSDVIAHLSTVLSKPSGIGEREIAYFDQQTRLYWRAREETVLPVTTLYTYVIRHIDDITMILARSHLPIVRSSLCETICRTVLLAGILLYDIGQYAKARQHYQMAFQAASEANNPVLQAILWGWMSFTWTYTKQYTEALRCVQYARSFAKQTTDILTQAWLGAIESEIQAHLHNRTACLQALSDMEHGGETSPSLETSYLFEFHPVLLLGYKGVCLQQFYQRQDPATYGFLQEAKEALEQALASEVPLKRKLYYLSDLAGVYARQGEVETACAYVVQSIPLLMQIGSASKTIRKHLIQVRALLQPNEQSSSVQALDEQMAPLLLET